MEDGMLDSCIASVVIPARNEESRIAACLNSIYDALEKFGRIGVFEVIVVDNDSSDKTTAIVRNFQKRYSNLILLEEKKVGQGYARYKGTGNAIRRSLARNKSVTDSFWIISTDSDVQVPDSWLINWYTFFQDNKPSVVTGNSIFGADFKKHYPVSSKIFKTVYVSIKKFEELFGVINVDGFNSAIERDCYEEIGPYYQPRIKVSEGDYKNLAGEDWDLSTRARVLGIRPIRVGFEPVIASPRRFMQNPKGFLDGTIYEGPFEKMEVDIPSPDIKDAESQYYLDLATLRLCVHYVEKPMLINKELLEDGKVIQLLGKNLLVKITNWMLSHKRPDFFTERNRFINNYLLKFHEVFGKNLRDVLFSDYVKI